MTGRSLLPSFPSGWYCVALAEEVKPGRLVSCQFMGHDVVIFRTDSGRLSLMEAYCPHLGAHLGHGGVIEGEVIRCPFHGFEFDRSGKCVATGYGTRPPPNARARTWPVCAVNGFVFAYHDGGTDCTDEVPWQIPDLDMKKWTTPLVRTFRLRGHPQETTENSVDIGHLSAVHGYQAVKTIRELRVTGPCLNARYGMRRPAPGLLKPIDAEFEVHVHGLGYSMVEVSITSLGLSTRHFVFSTPIDGRHINLRIALSLEKVTRSVSLPSWLRLVPGSLLNRFLPSMLMRGFARDVSRDFVIWRHKKFVRHPALAEGDGPLGEYRAWARQFYPASAGNRREVR